MDDPSEYVDFMVKYKDWISIKRLGIRPNTKPEEVSFHLALVRETIDRKAFAILGINTAALDSYAEKICTGMRKSYASLGSALTNMSGTEGKSTLKSACSDEKLAPLAEIYLLGRVISTLGYDTSLNQKAMAKIFPALKPAKVPGRLGKGKKKEATA